ncbi:MAG: sugar transferase [Ilumatobacteraceae bacterium]|nr:sugar transferase [Ilumatobacter sp.]MCO5329533.1 sugar transferase [Ilumatobacteraceae bacterium]
MSLAESKLSDVAAGHPVPADAVAGSVAGEGRRGGDGFFQRHKLKVLLIALDAVAIALAYFIVLFAGTYVRDTGTLRAGVLIAAAVVAGLWAERSQGLMLARVSAVRVVELTRLIRAAALLAVVVTLFDRVFKLDMRIRESVGGAFLALVFLVATRSAYRAWLVYERSHGNYGRRVLLVGADEEAARLLNLFSTHRELGMTVVGVVGDRTEAMVNHLEHLWIGEAASTVELAERYDVSGVVMSPMALPTVILNTLIRELQAQSLHVHLTTGIAGIDARRLRSLPLSYEPLLYVEPVSLSRVQLVMKRVTDIIASALILVLASPVMLAIALLIKLDDRGPVFFLQKRVGKDGSTFGVLKFRTMSVDAEARLAQLKADNERNGPLFKMERDPRVTGIGRFLRATSLDELPQLINVLRGEMSLVGPRPALPSEVEHFSADLRQREQVLPGITGLWQVEARDNPSFEAYRRLDLFYVENWSMVLDFVIILGTVEQLVMKVVLMVFRRDKSAESSTAVVVPDATRIAHR